MTYFTVNTKLHTLHTVKDGTKTHAHIQSAGLKAIYVGKDVHRVFTSAEDAKTCKYMLDLNGGGE